MDRGLQPEQGIIDHGPLPWGLLRYPFDHSSRPFFFIPTVSRSLSILGEEENTHTYNKQLNIARPVRVVLGLRNKSDLETCRAEW